MSSQHPEQQAEQGADKLPAHAAQDRLNQPVVRKGMFGVKGSGDTSGYGRLLIRQSPKVSSPRPYGGPGGGGEPGEFDEVADALERAFPDFGEAVERVVVDRGEITFFVRREHLPRSRRPCATSPPCVLSCAPGCRACTTPPTPAPSCTPSTTSCR